MSTTNQGAVSEAGSGTPPALMTLLSASRALLLSHGACFFTARLTHDAVNIVNILSAEFPDVSGATSVGSA